MKVKQFLSYLSYEQSNFKEFDTKDSIGFNQEKQISSSHQNKSKNAQLSLLNCVQYNLQFYPMGFKVCPNFICPLADSSSILIISFTFSLFFFFSGEATLLSKICACCLKKQVLGKRVFLSCYLTQKARVFGKDSFDL